MAIKVEKETSTQPDEDGMYHSPQIWINLIGEDKGRINELRSYLSDNCFKCRTIDMISYEP